MRWGEEGGGKSIPGRSRSYVLTGGEMGNFVRSRDAEQGESTGVVVRGIGQVGKEAEQVLRVQLTAVEGARDIDATLNIFGQERGVDSFCLQEQMVSTCDSEFRSGQPHLDSVLRGYKVIEKALLQSKELIMREVSVIARNQVLGRCLIACNTGCEAGGKTRGLFIVDMSERAQWES